MAQDLACIVFFCVKVYLGARKMSVAKKALFSSVAIFFNFALLTSAQGLGVQCNKKGSFINLCGYCVGATGTQDSEGFDKCGVCFGSNECMKCGDSKREDCEPDSFSLIHDLALNQTKVKLHLRSSSLSERTESIICILRASGASAERNLTTYLENDGMPFVSVDFSELQRGQYMVACGENISSIIMLNTTIKVVDSRQLEITSLSPSSVMSNVPFKVMMNVTMPQDTSAPKLCFTKVNGVVDLVVSAKIISQGLAECNSLTLLHSSDAHIGISETLEAALDSSATLKMKELEVHPPAPLIKSSTFSSDLRLIFMQFDQNINPAGNCRRAFSPETISLFGIGWQCWIRADQLVIQLGADPVVHPGSRISLSTSNDIQHFSANLNHDRSSQVYSTIVDDVTNQVVEPVYNVLAPRVACHGVRHTGLQSSIYAREMQPNDMKEAMTDENSVTILEVQQLGGQNLLYNWSVSFSPTNNRNSLSQRDMLMTWLSVRLLDKSVRSITTNRVSLNNSLMLSNVDYTVTVKGTNALGMTGEAKHIPLRLQDKTLPSAEHRARDSGKPMSACASGSPLDVLLSSPPATYADVDFRVEATPSCCDGILNSDVLGQIGYAWSVKSYNGSHVSLSPYQGKFLNIPSGTFHGGERYKISCDLYHKTINKSLGSASTSVVTLERGIKINMNVSGVGISTKQPLILDASTSRDLDNKHEMLQFEWGCRAFNSESGYGDNHCYLPNQKRMMLHEAYPAALKEPVLYLPPGSLPIGRYHFSVKVSRTTKELKSISSVATVEVSVLGGSPPLVFIPTKSLVNGENSFPGVINPDDGFTLSGMVAAIKAGCHIIWRGIDQPGYITLNQSLLHHEPYTAVMNYDKPREFSAELLPGLLGDAKYRFRLSALCSNLESNTVEFSYVDIDIITDAPPVVKPLTVEPLQGEALVTKFTFSTQPAYDDLLDYPLRYSFGFQILEEGSDNPGPPKIFHSSNLKLSSATYLPAISHTETKIQSLLRVCDVRQICHTIDGPLVMLSAPKELTSGHVELLSNGFSSFLMAEEYEDAIMLVESSMLTLEVFDDKTLYQLASKRVEQAVNSQLKSFEKRLDASPEEVHAAMRFLKAANAALKHGAFSQETLQRLVAFKDRILGMLTDGTQPLPDSQSDWRRKRQAQTGGAEQPINILQPETVRTLLSVSEVAIFNLSDTNKALNEKRKLLQNVSFFMDSLCRGLHNSVPLFIGSRVVSFSVQRLNMQIKYKDDLAIPDWRSSKSGGTPVNATAQIRLGEDVQLLLSGKMVCMGAAYYPMDFLSEVTQVSIKGEYRHSSIYQVKIIQNTSQKVTLSENYEGLDVKKQSVKVKIPIWSEQINSGFQLQCRVWLHGAWDSHSCRYIKSATLINRPAVECLCSTVGYYAVFAVESPLFTTTTTPLPPTSARGSPSIPEGTTGMVPPAATSRPTVHFEPTLPVSRTQPTSVQVSLGTEKATIAISTETPPTLPPGIPIPNTSKNFTFKIQEEFSAIVGSQEKAFISQLKYDILKQVEMPANMIASINLSPGSILVTLHLVDTDIRTVDDVLPSLAAVLQDGRLSVSSVDGRHLSVPPQSLKLLQRRTENSFVPWIVIGCSGFGLFSVGALVIAAIIVKRQMRDMDFSDHTRSPEVTNKTPSYGRFHFEQTLDGSEATLSRYRSSVNNPLVVSTLGGLASVMGTNATVPPDHLSSDMHFMLKPPQSEAKSLSTPTHQTKPITNPNNSSGNTSGSSGNSSINRVASLQKQASLPDGSSVNLPFEPEEEDSGIAINGRGNNSRSQTPESNGQQAPDVHVLPGTPTGRGDDQFSLTITSN